MPFYFCWGDSFLAIFGEFWPWQIAQIHAYANELFERRPHDADLERLHGIRVSNIPFEMFGYGLVLVLRGDVWMLEVASLPPHAEPGQRIRKARRAREQQECKGRRDEKPGGGGVSKTGKRPRSEAAKTRRKAKSGDAARTISTAIEALEPSLRPIFLKLYNINQAARRELRRLRHTVALFQADMKAAIPASRWTVRQQLLHWTALSREDCRDANIAGWTRDRLPPGCQRERRLFFADFLPIWLDTIAPIEPIFVRGGRSVFGEPAMEGECVS